MTRPSASDLKRFRALVASYGADRRRWPEAERARMDGVLAASAAARDLLARGGPLDDALLALSRDRDGRLWQPGEAEASLIRLRAGVAARISAMPQRRGGRIRHALPRWRMAVAGGTAILAGLAAGWMEAALAAVPADLLSILQASPIRGLAW